MGRLHLTEPTHAQLVRMLHAKEYDAAIPALRRRVIIADGQFGPTSYEAASERFGLANALEFNGERVEAEK